MKPHFIALEDGSVSVEWIDKDRCFALILDKTWSDSGWYFINKERNGELHMEDGLLPLEFWGMLKISKPEIEPLPDIEHGTIFLSVHFLDVVEQGVLLDNDGTGYYANENGYFPQKHAVPSEIRENGIDSKYTHVVWFSK